MLASMEVTMSLLNERQKPGDFYMPVICWRCDAPMKIRTIMPTLTSEPHDEIVYGCPACHLQRKQIVLRAVEGDKAASYASKRAGKRPDRLSAPWFDIPTTGQSQIHKENRPPEAVFRPERTASGQRNPQRSE